MVSKSSILRIIAEIVKSYPVTASIVANHQYQADPNTTIIKQVCITNSCKINLFRYFVYYTCKIV